MTEEAKSDWPLRSAEGRWKGMGPYYAMFPVDFAREFVEAYSSPGDTVIDPFCGRGTTNYVARVLGRNSIGCDLNPVAWVYTKAKTDPVRQIGRILKRVEAIQELVTTEDRKSKNDFQRLAWSPEVLGFLNSARRELNWRHSKTDWTLAAFILVYLHAKMGGGLSNQMRQSKSMSPDYAVRWWTKKGLSPPEIDPVEFLQKRIRWRYEKGLISRDCDTRILLGDSSRKLSLCEDVEASLLITSPPYMGITNYQYDNWIRLWALGGPELPEHKSEYRHCSKVQYKKLLKDVFSTTRSLLKDDATVITRTDRRKFTLETTAYTLVDIWPEHQIYGRASIPSKPSQTALFGDTEVKPGEVDLLLLPVGRTAPPGFINLESFEEAA